MAVFDALSAMAGRAVARVYSDLFAVLPRTVASLDVNARRIVDAGREELIFSAVLHEYFSRVDKQSNGSPRSLSALTAANLAEEAGHSTARIRIKFPATALPFRLAQGDRVRRLSNGLVYNVAEVRLSSHAKFTADLNLLETPSS